MSESTYTAILASDPRWPVHFSEYEGCSETLYLDGEGIVTVGIGCQVFDHSTLSMRWRTSGQPASRQDILNDYNTVREMQPGHTLTYYANSCLLYMEQSEIDRLFRVRLSQFIDEINADVIPLHTLPEPAQMVIVDMAFNLGVNGLTSKFPKFMKAIHANDWLTAAAECTRKGIQQSRNDWTTNSLLSLVTGAD